LSTAQTAESSIAERRLPTVRGMDIAQTLTELEAAVRDVEAAEAALAEGKQRLHRTALRALVTADAETDLQQLVSRLYWEVPALSVRSIGAAVGGDASARALAGPGPAIPPCADCGSERKAASRTQRSNPPVRCDGCEEARRAAEAEAWQREYAEQGRRARAEEEQRAWHTHLWDAHPDLRDAAIEAGLPPWTCGCGVTSWHQSF
jgi:hypothetical protein